MENCRKGFLFFFLSVFFIAFSAFAHAQTVEERKVAANYDETLPDPGEARAVEVVASVPQVPEEPLPAQAVALPVQAAPVVMPEVPLVPQENPGRNSPQASSKDMPEAEVFAPSNPSGLVEVSGYKYPVYIFAPKDYKTDRTYAMIMIAPAKDAKAEQQIETLTGLAQRKSVFILAPYVLWPKDGDTPYALDSWLLKIKNDMTERFPISKKRIYLIGKDSGAHYAAYMAVKYPKEFSAVALLGEAWDGPFSQLVELRKDVIDQVPFYIALKADGEAKARNQVWFDKLQKKGYLLHLVEYKTDEELADLDFKKSVFDWMEATGQSWAASVARSQQGWKGRFKKGVKDFFAV